MWIIAFIDQAPVIEQILTHLGLWPAPAPSPPESIAAYSASAASLNGIVRPGLPCIGLLRLPWSVVHPATSHLTGFRLTARPPAAVSSPPSRRGRALR